MPQRKIASSQTRPVVTPDTGKKGVQPVGKVNPRPPRPTPPPQKSK